MVREAVESAGGETTRKEIKEYIHAHYKNIKENTIDGQVTKCTVNIPSRTHHPTNQHERKCESKYDLLFRGQNGEISLYNPLIHGKWGIKEKSGKYIIESEEHECFLLVDTSEIEECQNKMDEALMIVGNAAKTIVQWHGSSNEEDVWWFSKYGFWWARGTSQTPTSDGNVQSTVYWNGFGVANKTKEFDPTKVSVTCDINVSTRTDGKSQGVFVKDKAGKYYIAHTGRFANQGKKQTLEDHVSWNRIDICNQARRSVFVISALDDPRLAQNLNQFIRAVHKARNGSPLVKKEFAFVDKDFDSLTGSKTDALYIRDRFKTLGSVLRDRLSQYPDVYQIYTAHPMSPPKSDQAVWKDHMWLGIVPDYAIVNRPQESVQFQVSLFSRKSVACMIWISYVASNRLDFVKAAISDDTNKFAQLLRALPEGYTITAERRENEAVYSFPTSGISEPEISKIIEVMNNKNVDFGIVKSWGRKDAIARGIKIVDDITETIETLMPTYRFLHGRDLPKSGTRRTPGSPDPQPYTIDDIIRDGCFLDKPELEKMKSTLETEKNIILQGPPGTGKTWLAKRLAFALTGHRPNRRVRTFQFHPNLSYEDFVRGWRPDDADASGRGRLRLVDGPFLESIRDAIADRDSDFVIVIEEINRGNPANIFGEMLTLLEADKRVESEGLQLSHTGKDGKSVYIPENLYVIGTMNIADRSIAMVDVALRRRFGFFNLEPLFNDRWEKWLRERGVQEDVLGMIKERLESLNDTISADTLLGPHYVIGHSYVTPNAQIADSRQWFIDIVTSKIGPLLSEYWITDKKKAHDETKNLLKDFGR